MSGAPEAILVEADGGLGAQAAVWQSHRIGTLAPLQTWQQLAAIWRLPADAMPLKNLMRNDSSKSFANSHAS